MDFDAICRAAVCEALGYQPDKVRDDLEIDDLDSLDALEILMQIEEDSGLDLGDLAMPATFGALVAEVRKAAEVAA